MKAIIYERYGTIDNLDLKEVEAPAPKDNEVLIKVHAVSINDWDMGLLLGVPFVNRLINGIFRPKIKILGSDIAGRVEATGNKVTRFKKGDRVYGDQSNRWGGFAEYVCAPETALAQIPSSMSYEQAAAIPQAGMLAVQGLLDVGALQNGEKVLINGAGGGVGTFAVQIAKQYGAIVTGVDSMSKHEEMLSAGFDHCIDYLQTDFTDSAETYDLILDTKTNRSVVRYLHALKPGGRYITVGGTRNLIKILLLGPLISLLFNKKAALVILKANKDLEYMNRMFEEGKVTPVLETYPLDRYLEAFDLYERADHKGKVVLKI